MNYKQLKKQIKEEQKSLAQRITRGKFLRKPDNRSTMTEDEKKILYRHDMFQTNVLWMGSDYRNKHIAYCMFFNITKYEDIERTTRGNNRPNMHRVNEYIHKWEIILNEDVRDCA